jgi:hypothetical protein
MTSAAGFAAYLGLLALFAAGAWLRPASAIAAVICLFGLKQLGQSSHGWIAAHAVVTNFVVAAIVLIAILRRLAAPGAFGRPRSPAYWLALAFYGYALLSFAWTLDLDDATLVWAHDYPYIVISVVVAPWLATTRTELRTAVGWLTFAGGAVVLALMATGQWGDRGLVVATGSIVDETNPLAIADLAGGIAIAAVFFVPERSRALAWLRLPIAALCALAIVRSGSRGQLLALCASIAVLLPVGYSLLRLRGVALAALALAVVATALALGAQSYVHWYDARWDRGTALEDVAGRWAMVTTLLQEWSRNGATVLFGVGNSASFSPRLAGFYPHNVPLEILGEEGLIGFGIYLSLLGVVVADVITGARRSRGLTADRALIAAVGGYALFTLLVSLKEGNAEGSVTFFLTAILASLVARAASGGSESEGDARDPLPATHGRGTPAYPNLLR